MEEEARSRVVKDLEEQLEGQKQRFDTWKKQSQTVPEKKQEDVRAEEGTEQRGRFFQPILVLGILGFLVKDLFLGLLELPKPVDDLLGGLFLVMIAAGLGLLLRSHRKGRSALDQTAGKKGTLSDPEASQKSVSLDLAVQQAAVSLEKAAEGLKDAMQEQELSLENVRQQKAEKEMPGFEERKLKKQSEAAALARDTILRLSRKMQTDQEERLRENMSEILERMTSGNYEELFLDEKRQVKVRQDMRARSPEAYSEATMQQMYFAYRMAAGACLNKEENLPFLLDEVFAAYDEDRLRKTLSWLAEQQNQIFIFTCRRLEAELLDAQGIPFLEISLS